MLNFFVFSMFDFFLQDIRSFEHLMILSYVRSLEGKILI